MFAYSSKRYSGAGGSCAGAGAGSGTARGAVAKRTVSRPRGESRVLSPGSSTRHVGLRLCLYRQLRGLYSFYQSIQPVQEALFVVTLLPRGAVVHLGTLGHASRLGEVDQPRSDFLIVVDYENATADDLVLLEEVRVLEEVPNLAETSEDGDTRTIIFAEEFCDGGRKLVRLAHFLQVGERGLAWQLDGFDAETLFGGGGALLAELHVAQFGDSV